MNKIEINYQALQALKFIRRSGRSFKDWANSKGFGTINKMRIKSAMLKLIKEGWV